MRGKFAVLLDGQVAGTIIINLDVPQNVRQAAALKGYGPQEIDNLVGQKFQEFVDLLALDEE